MENKKKGHAKAQSATQWDYFYRDVLARERLAIELIIEEEADPERRLKLDVPHDRAASIAAPNIAAVRRKKKAASTFRGRRYAR